MNIKISYLRKIETHLLYEEHKNKKRQLGDSRCGLCLDEPIKQFKYWKIIDNKFPYDEVAEAGHMLVPLNHLEEKNISKKAWDEYKEIKKYLDQEYDMIIENTTKNKSIPSHFHLHLLKLKQRIFQITEPQNVFVFSKQINKSVAR